jgi:predicted nucleic acid-binding protein
MTTPLRCVVDASVAVKQFIRDPFSEKAIELFALLADPQVEFFVPDLFYIEIANILWKYLRVGQLTANQVQEDLTALEGYPLKVFSTVTLMKEAVALGINHNITAYDSAYVVLSQRVNAPLLILDRKLFDTLAITPFDVRWFVDFSLSSVAEEQS